MCLFRCNLIKILGRSYEMFTLFDEALLLSLHGTTVYAYSLRRLVLEPATRSLLLGHSGHHRSAHSQCSRCGTLVVRCSFDGLSTDVEKYFEELGFQYSRASRVVPDRPAVLPGSAS